jgi:Helix-turn-helix domain
MKYVTPLSDAAIETLHQMHAHHPSRRARRRAHSLLLSHQRYPIPQIARFYQVDQRRVSAWMDRWPAWGLGGLAARPRSGRPAIVTAEEQQNVYAYLNDSPKDVEIAHLLGIPAPEHLVHQTIIVGLIVARIRAFKPVPVLGKDLFEDIPGRWGCCSHEAASLRGVGFLW